MPTTEWTRFSHPGGVYRLEYPAHWEHLEKDEARSCGFGPHDRDDVGLWISLMPVSVDTDRLAEELPRILGQAIRRACGGANVRRDPTLRHYGVKADVQKEGEGGHHWLIAGGDVVLFASSRGAGRGKPRLEPDLRAADGHPGDHARGRTGPAATDQRGAGAIAGNAIPRKTSSSTRRGSAATTASCI